MIERQLGCLGCARQRLAIEAVLEDRADRSVGPGADLQPASARRLEPVDAVLAAKAENAEAGAEAPLGMGPGGQDSFDQAGGSGSGGRGFGLDALVGSGVG